MEEKQWHKEQEISPYYSNCQNGCFSKKLHIPTNHNPSAASSFPLQNDWPEKTRQHWEQGQMGILPYFSALNITP